MRQRFPIFSRQRFLCGATATMLSVPAFMRAMAAEAAANGNIVYVIELGGGNDGFNTVIDFTAKNNNAYNDLRPGIAISAAQVQAAQTGFDADHTKPSNTNSTYGMHPVMGKMRDLYGQGNVALVMGVGFPPAQGGFGHTNARYNWETGTINRYQEVSVGWLGATFDQLSPNSTNLPPMVSFAGRKITMKGAKSPLLEISGTSDIGTFNVPTGYGSDTAQRRAALAASSVTGLANPIEAFAGETASSTLTYMAAVQSYGKAQLCADYPAPDPVAGKPPTNLNAAFKQAARLILGGAPVQSFFSSMGNFDTHSNQNASQPPLLQELSYSVYNFITYLKAKNPAIAKKVIVMTMSDFGRRIETNNTAGTDHGTANISFVCGAGVKGGIYGQYPDMANRDHNGNVLVDVDFRNQLSDVIQYMGGDPSAIMGPGQTYPKLGFI